ncbi:MAG: hypothetical protein QG597_607 [Actinomycetota bacterium]|nr:hypothetical protein [Actinomycetota bacterium]
MTTRSAAPDKVSRLGGFAGGDVVTVPGDRVAELPLGDPLDDIG